ncbi:MAG: hypothetical protein PHR44_03865 [Candidatus Omnitrophica bacterium]|nr:hypothetical protein [Candidatus Omnitrophota bacterium]
MLEPLLNKPVGIAVILRYLFFPISIILCFSPCVFAAQPVNISVEPSSGTFEVGETHLFTTTYSDSDTRNDIRFAEFLIRGAEGSVRLLYVPGENKISLMGDNGSWSGNYAPGSNHTVENRYATLDCSKTMVHSNDPDNITIAWALKFKETFSGRKDLLLAVTEWPVSGRNPFIGWDKKGDITVTETSATSIPIAFGQTLLGSIDDAGEKDDFIFSGINGDVITFFFAKTSGNISPYLELYGPDGALIGSASVDYPYSGRFDKTLTVKGIFKIALRDKNNRDVGTYSLSMQRVNNPGLASALNFGQHVSGAIDSFAKIVTYKFSASVNDKICMPFSSASGSSSYFQPYLELYDSTGKKIADAYTMYPEYEGQVLSATITVSGEFVLIVSDKGLNSTGTYELVLQRVNNPENPTGIRFGQTIQGSIDTGSDIDVFSFNASANDVVYVCYMKTSAAGGSFWPYFGLYDSTGTPIAWSDSSGKFIHKLSATGRFYLLVTDYRHFSSGTYEFTLQRVNNPVNAVYLDFGQTVSGAISTLADIDVYSFTASANDVVTVRFATTSTTYGALEPNLELYDTAGNKIPNLSTYARSGSITGKLDASGMFYLLVTDIWQNGTGTYELTIQRINNPGNVRDLNYNSSVEDTIDSTGIKMYRFTAAAGDAVTLYSHIKTYTSIFDLYLGIYDAIGALLTSSSGRLKYTFTTGGTFYLFVGNSYLKGGGRYKLILLSGDVPYSSIDLIDPLVSLSRPLTGEAIESGSTYTIRWHSSDNVGISFQEIRLSTDGAVTYPIVIASGLSADTQSYNWAVPADLSTTRARIKIVVQDAATNMGEDANRDDFLILNAVLPAGAVDINYEYDNLHRLTSTISTEKPSLGYVYDSLGNRTELDIIRGSP